MRAQRLTTTDLPGGDVSRMSGHWLLARIGKRVLRPGGLALTKRLLTSLAIDTSDDVVEFAPGLGTTARLILKRGPRSYVGLERDIKAMNWAARRRTTWIQHAGTLRIGATSAMAAQIERGHKTVRLAAS